MLRVHKHHIYIYPQAKTQQEKEEAEKLLKQKGGSARYYMEENLQVINAYMYPCIYVCMYVCMYVYRRICR
jgi:hypothetical protein